MRNEHVVILNDVNCEWSGEPPRYRCYVNNELFTERTWIWSDIYLEEQIEISGQPGQYQIRYELVAPSNAVLTVSNYRVVEGPAKVTQQGRITLRESSYENA